MRGSKDFRAGWALLLLPGLLLAGCDRGRDTVAQAGDFRLEVEDAAQIIASAPGIPGDPEIVEAIADIWIDVVLLAHAANAEGGFDRLDLSPVIRQHRDQQIVMRLRDTVIQVNADLTDEELREIYEEEGHGVEVRARHILLRTGEGATDSERDSVRALAEELHDRIQAGESFEQLASEYSEDPGSAAGGGDLGFFRRGTMVPPFEEAAFALQPGELSDVVQTDFGLHLIQVDERRVTPFEELADRLRSQLIMEWTQEAESIYLERVEGPANIQVADDAAEQVRELLDDVDTPLRGRRAGTALATYEGGAYTLAQMQSFVLAQPRQIRAQIEMAPDEQIVQFIRDLTRDRLLVADAERRGLDLEPGEIEALESELREEYAQFAGFLGVASIEPREGESLVDAVDRGAKEVVIRLVRGELQLVPLGPLSLPLRTHYSASISETASERVAERVEELREEGFGAPPSPSAPVTPPAPGGGPDDAGS